MNLIVLCGYDNCRAFSGERDEIPVGHSVVLTVGHRYHKRPIAVDSAVNVLSCHKP